MTKQNKKIYVGLMNRIAISILLNQLMFAILGAILPAAEDALILKFGGSMTLDAIFRTLECIVYFISFTVPVAVFNRMNKNAEREIYEPVESSKKSPFDLFVIFGISLGAINLFAYVNYYIVNAFWDYSDFTQENFWAVELDHPYQIVIYAIYAAFIPALVEELMFRGTFCRVLTVYGKGTAVVISALLFALMHTNIEQLLYTFVAGLCLGWIYVESKSLVLPFLLHFVNNGISVVLDVVRERVGIMEYDNASFFIEAVMWVMMALCLIIFLLGVLKRGTIAGKLQMKPDENGEEVLPLSFADKLGGFGSLGMILFVIYSFAVMTMFILMSVGKV